MLNYLSLTPLEGINLFLDKAGIIFILGADIEYLRQAASLYLGTGDERSNDYLEETIQLRFDIPPITTAAMTDYIKTEKDAVTDELAKNWHFVGC
jgi:hypothetical protein